jgi:hypothetical protein
MVLYTCESSHLDLNCPGALAVAVLGTNITWIKLEVFCYILTLQNSVYVL